jgi:Cys-tRNA(Pro) deacylase
MQELPEPVARVSRVMVEAKVEARLDEFPQGTPTAEAAAAAAGCELEQIVKSLVFLCDGRPVLALVPGDRRVDCEKAARLVGAAQAKIAGPEDVRRTTGFEPGGVAPFPVPEIEVVLMDQRLAACPVVWFGAGSSRHMAALAPGDLARLAGARLADVAAEGG